MEEKKTAPVPNESQFSLSKVKLVANGGLDVIYEVTEVVGSESYCNKYHIECAKDTHPDLKNAFKELVPIIARVFNITSFLSVVEMQDFKANKEQLNKCREAAEELLNNIEPRGISLSGKGDNVGVIISAVYTCAEDRKAALNTPRLNFNTLCYGFEEELENLCSIIEREVYAYLFENKKAQLELFDGDDFAAEQDAANNN